MLAIILPADESIILEVHIWSQLSTFFPWHTQKFSEKSEMKEGKKANIHFLNNDLVSGRIIVYSHGFFSKQKLEIVAFLKLWALALVLAN